MPSHNMIDHPALEFSSFVVEAKSDLAQARTICVAQHSVPHVRRLKADKTAMLMAKPAEGKRLDVDYH